MVSGDDIETYRDNKDVVLAVQQCGLVVLVQGLDVVLRAGWRGPALLRAHGMQAPAVLESQSIFNIRFVKNNNASNTTIFKNYVKTHFN